MDDKKILLKSQQGELDAVLMYQKVAEKITDPEIRELILETAADEGRHASVFHKLTGQTLRPKKFKSIMVPLLMTILGKRKAFELMANGEYDAVKKYAAIIDRYPTVVSVQGDEKMHGDRMMEISKKF